MKSGRAEQSPYAVPKDRQGVTVHLDGGRAIDGVVFLDAGPGGRTLHSKMTAFLEDGNAFFPLVTIDEGKTEFVGKARVRMIEVDCLDDPETKTVLLSLMQLSDVIIEFPDGIIIRGALMSEAPVEKARLSDCLNLPSRFLSVRGERKLVYINKERIFRVLHDTEGRGKA